MSKVQNSILFEVSWEVCNKVGGINTVIRSKIAEAVAEFGENYYLIGPYLARNTEFEETDEECWLDLRRSLGERGFECRFGRWTVPGRPKVILVRAGNRYNVEQLLFRLWERYGVDSIAGGWDYMEPVLFSTACGEVITSLTHDVFSAEDSVQVVAQFHEWMTGAGLLYVKEHAPDVATVFTTHATILGRSMTGAGRHIYRELETISPPDEAKQHNIMAKHSMETVSAREADCFTTVSRITAQEAHKILGSKAAVITENGMDVAAVPNFAHDRQSVSESRQRLLKFASDFFKEKVPENARLILISGRYEFANKGIDVFLEALANVRKTLKNQSELAAFLFVLGPHLEHRVDGGRSGVGGPAICTHRLPDENSDPILRKCLELGIKNEPGDRIKAVFVPVYLSEGDGVLDMSYYDVLKSFDLTVFPSKYEPWGYTPLESAVYSVPTVTTDLAGFGLWVRELADIPQDQGVFVLDRMRESHEQVVQALTARLQQFMQWNDEELLTQRQAARRIGEKASWSDFYRKYLEAYSLALRSAEKRAFRREAIETGLVGHVITARESAQPHFRTFIAEKTPPKKIARLRELAYNLWWSWHPQAIQLFARIDPYLWESSKHNPLVLLDETPSARLEELAQSETYVHDYESVMSHFDEYMKDRKPADAFTKSSAISWSRPVAYFSTEFGLHESLPLYSGGLGVLSGDHLKSASDLKLPMIAVGLFYSHGYFKQRIDRDGNQVAEYPLNDHLTLPLRQLQADDETPITISVELPGRTLYASIWKLEVGRVTVYLLHSDVPENTAQDRKITDQLYVGDERTRIEQEILLGIGGAKALRRLGISPSVYHLNEGHSAFLVLENIRHLVKTAGMSFEEAREAVKSQTVFTTHTPVEAGNERFSRDLMQYYFANYFKEVGISPDRFFELGRLEVGERQPFVMTILALKSAYASNGVSQLHGKVARRMWEKVWRGVHPSMVPIGSITNGVHPPTFVGEEMRALLDTYIGFNWDNALMDQSRWEKLQNIPDHLFWEAKLEMKQRLMALVREYIAQNWAGTRQGDVNREDVIARLRSSTLTIGFARRFAPYKRATLLFSDLERLDRLVNNPRRPVQVIFAGKAHPKDQYGCDLVRQVVELSRDSRFAGRIVFLENYDLQIAKSLVQGVDVWLNTPRRPHEASGTSGQKAGMNAGINLSVADGWWYEGATEGNGWTIGPGASEVDETTESDDIQDASEMYSLLEDAVVPLYYQRNSRGLPERWLTMMRRSLDTALPYFNTHRMVADYFNEMYQPCAERGKKLLAASAKAVRQLAEWKRSVSSRFSSVHLLDITTSGPKSGCIQVGKTFAVKVRLDIGDVEPDELCVELVVGKADPEQQISNPVEIELKAQPSEAGHEHIVTFAGEYKPEVKGNYSYGIRIVPNHPDLVNKFDTGLIIWA